jgi:hypothetical protein
MTINYGPYEPPPPTEPPPPGFEPVGPPNPSAELRPSGVGVLLTVLGISGTPIGLFGLPVQRYGPDPQQAVYFGDVRRLAAGADDSYLPHVASGFARIWWNSGLLAALCILILLAGAACVADSARVRRPLGRVTVATAVVIGFLHWLAMVQTADYNSVVEALAPSNSLFHASGLGPWIAFIGLAATAIGGMINSVARTRPAQQ